MSFSERFREEIASIGLTTLFFATWFAMLVLLKWLVLAEYSIEFTDVSIVLIGALIVAKVVVILDKVPIDLWTRDRPAFVHVLVRTALYGVGILVVLLLEKAFESRHEYGGFVSALTQVFRHQDIPHVLAATIGVTGALLMFNALLVIQRHLGEGGILRMFLSPLPEPSDRRS